MIDRRWRRAPPRTATGVEKSPSGTYVLMGQATSLNGEPFGEYVTAARTSAEGTSPCVEPTAGDTAGMPSATPLIGGCQVEILHSASNRSGFLLENYTDLTVCSSNQTHPDAHNSGPEKVGCFVNENGGVSCCWTGKGAALNDPSGRERGSDGRYLPDTHHCHMFSASSTTYVNAAKRPATRNSQIDPTTPIIWRPVSPLLLVANGGTVVSGCEPVEELNGVHVQGWGVPGNARLAKIENGKVPCLHKETLELAQCDFTPNSGSWASSPSGNMYALIGQAVPLQAASGDDADYIVGAQVNTAGNVPCVDASGSDTAGRGATSSLPTFSAFCVNETALSSQNATHRPLVNHADNTVATSSNPHPDAHLERISFASTKRACPSTSLRYAQGEREHCRRSC